MCMWNYDPVKIFTTMPITFGDDDGDGSSSNDAATPAASRRGSKDSSGGRSSSIDEADGGDGDAQTSGDKDGGDGEKEEEEEEEGEQHSTVALELIWDPDFAPPHGPGSGGGYGAEGGALLACDEIGNAMTFVKFLPPSSSSSSLAKAARRREGGDDETTGGSSYSYDDHGPVLRLGSRAGQGASPNQNQNQNEAGARPGTTTRIAGVRPSTSARSWREGTLRWLFWRLDESGVSSRTTQSWGILNFLL